MDISQIVSVSGHGGLFKVISQIKNGIIVEGLEDQKRMPIYASQKVVALEDISIYTYTDDIPLKEVLLTIQETLKSEQAPEGKKASANDLKSFMETVMPDYDKERVYVSDIKKLAKWYNILNSLGYITKEEAKEKEEKPKTTADTKKGTKKAEKKPKQASKASAKPKGGARQAKSSGSKKG